MMHVLAAVLFATAPLQGAAGKESFAEDVFALKLSAESTERFDRPAGDWPKWSAGFGVDVYTGFGSVFNDVIGASLRAGYRIDERWGVSVRLFRTDFDFEDPADNVFGRSGTPVSDASIDMIMFSATARWHFLAPGGPFDFYVGAGAGLAFPGSGEAVNLPQVDIEVEGNFGPEVHFVVGGAVRIFDPLHFTAELRLMQSFTDYDVEDRLTGETDTEGGWAGYGIGLGVEWRF